MKIQSTKLFTRTSVIAIASSLAFTLAACSGSSDSVRELSPIPTPSPTTTPSPTPTPTPTPTSSVTLFSVSGRISKGIVKNGIVEVRLASASPTSTPIATGTTDATGAYSIDIPEDSGVTTGSLLVVTVKAGPNTTMVCDVPSGCGTVAFGADVDLSGDTDFQLRAAAPAPAPNGVLQVNMSALTELAVALAEENGGLNDANYAAAESQIADLFGLTSTDFASFPVVDVTTETGDGVSADALKASLISAGVLGAGIEDGEDVGLGLRNLVNSFTSTTNNGVPGQFITNEDVDDLAVVSLEDILGFASQVVDTSNTLTGETVEEAESSVTADLVEASSQPDGEVSDSQPSPNIGATDLDKAKAFVADLKLIQAALEAEGTVDALEQFATNVGDSAELIGDDMSDLLEVAIQAVVAAGQAYGAFLEDPTITTFESTDFGVTLTVAAIDGSSENAVITLAEQTISGATASLSISFEFDIDNVSTPVTAILDGDGSISMSGTVENANAVMTLAEGNIAATGGTSNFTETDESTDFDLTINEVVLNADVSLAQKADQQLAFDGVILADLLGVATGLEEDVLINGLTAFPFPDVTVSEDVSVLSGSAGLSSAAFAASGDLSVDGETMAVTLQADVSGDGIEVLVTPIATSGQLVHTVSNGVLSWELPNGETLLAELTTVAEAEAEFSSFARRDVLDFRNEILFEEFFDSNGAVARLIADDTTTPVLRVSGNLFGLPADLVHFIQADVFVERFNFPFASETVVNTPPNEISAYLNGFVGTPLNTVVCSDDQIIEIDGFEFSPTGGEANAFVVADNVFCDSVINENVVTVIADPSLNSELDFGINFIGALTQDVVAIDPANPEVRFEIAGETNVSAEDIGGAGDLTISFSGRRFTTNTFSFDLDNGFSTDAITVLNQDDVLMTLTENEGGEIVGDIKIGDAIVATIDESQGAPTVAYSDNTFESLFN